MVYLPYREDAVSWATILARAQAAPQAVAADCRRQIQSIDPDLPVFNVQMLDEIFSQQRWAWRVFGTMFLVFACVALVLSAIGIYGVMEHAVPNAPVNSACGSQWAPVRRTSYPFYCRARRRRPGLVWRWG